MAFANGTGGENGGRNPIQRAADSAVLTVGSRLALIVLVAVVGYLLPRAWEQLQETTRLLDRVSWRLDQKDVDDARRDEAVLRLERRLRAVERATPALRQPWPQGGDDQL